METKCHLETIRVPLTENVTSGVWVSQALLYHKGDLRSVVHSLIGLLFYGGSRTLASAHMLHLHMIWCQSISGFQEPRLGVGAEGCSTKVQVFNEV